MDVSYLELRTFVRGLKCTRIFKLVFFLLLSVYGLDEENEPVYSKVVKRDVVKDIGRVDSFRDSTAVDLGAQPDKGN